MNPVIMAEEITKSIEDEYLVEFARTPETQALMLRVAATYAEFDTFNSVSEVFGRIWDLSEKMDGDYAKVLDVINIQERTNARMVSVD